MKIQAALFVCALAAASAPVFAQSYSFTIFAGTPPPTGSRDAAGAEARFHNPIAVAVDAAGNSYVADRDTAIIRRVTPAGVVSTLAGLAGSTGFADGSGAAARFLEPAGIALDSAGNLFVSDISAHTIRRITPQGAVTTFAGLGGTAGATDGAGSAARFRNPRGIAIDSANNVYVSDAGNYTIRKISPAGDVTTLAGAAGFSGNADAAGGNARFTDIAGLAVDGSGNIYGVDKATHVVRRITAAGAVTTIAGQAGTFGNTNGAGTAARFNTPFGIAVGPGGTLFIADTTN